MKGSSGAVTSVMTGLVTFETSAELLGCFYRLSFVNWRLERSGLARLGLARVWTGREGSIRVGRGCSGVLALGGPMKLLKVPSYLVSLF